MNSASHPRLIVFEGVDAAGKSTICQHYVSALLGRGIVVKMLSFPGKSSGSVGELVYRLHHNPSDLGIDRVTEPSLQALHIASHLDVIESTIIPALKNGETIVLDRYWWSTWVYGVIGGVRLDVLDALIEAERLTWGDWKPSVLFHVTRSTPLREEPAEKWMQLQSKYAELRQQEAGRYPIAVLENEGHLDETVQQALIRSHGQT